MSGDEFDLGHGVTITFTTWRDHEKAGLFETHHRPGTSERCPDPDAFWSAAIMFDLPGVREAFPGRPLWTVESWAPFTLSPSLLCGECGHHGFIKQGRWVPA